MSYSGPDAQTIATAVSSSSKRGGKGWWPMRAVCHGGQSEPPKGGSLGVRNDSTYGVAFHCWQGCTREHIIEAVESVTRLTIKGQFEKNGASPSRPPPSPTTTRTRQAKRQPTRTLAIPEDARHPARKWLAARNLWHPSKPLPDSIRWLPSDNNRPPEMAGSIVHPYAPIPAWLDALPDVPPASSVQLVNIDRDGRPTLDKLGENGLNKRSLGQLTYAYFLLGVLSPEDAEGVLVVEGLADGLAVVSHYNPNAAVIVMAGTSAMYNPSPELLEYMARFSKVVRVEDRDPAGRNASLRLAGKLFATHGVKSKYIKFDGVKDAAAWSASFTPNW